MTMAAFAPPLIFNLAPQNRAARLVVDHDRNARFKHENTTSVKTVSLGVGIGHEPKNQGQLISFGTDPGCCDILLRSGFPRQCHFSIHPRTHEVLLHDDSQDGSTTLLSSNKPEESRFSIPEAQHRQRVVLTAMNNAHIRIFDALFKLTWSGNKDEALERAQSMVRFAPDHACISTPIDLLENGQITHRRIRILGEGASAVVYLTMNLKTGDHLAVKMYKFNGQAEVEKACKDAVRKEVNLIASLHHVSHQPSRHD
jgi:hypothetical protein